MSYGDDPAVVHSMFKRVRRWARLLVFRTASPPTELDTLVQTVERMNDAYIQSRRVTI